MDGVALAHIRALAAIPLSFGVSPMGIVAWLLRDALFPIQKELKIMSAALDRITAEVAETRTAVSSVIALVSGLSEQIRELKEDPAALEALADELDAAQSEIAAAVTENTPTSPTDE